MVHLQTVKKAYSLRKAELGPEQSVIFKESSITLDIPRKGHILADQWKVFPAIPPKVNMIETCYYFGLIICGLDNQEGSG